MEFSDHKKPQIDLNKLLPDVYVSDVSTTINDQAFNRMFTKTDTTHVAGQVGNYSAKNIQEPTVYRQAHQLVPTMVSKLGDQTTALSFKMFRERMELLGVDFDRFNKWCQSTVFNWVPPINLDKFINYRNYFWKGQNSNDIPQYLTIENKCKLKQSLYDQLVNRTDELGETWNVTNIDFVNNSIYVSGNGSESFVPSLVIFTNNSNLNVFNSTYWTVYNSSYDAQSNSTKITFFESMAHVSDNPPPSPIVDHLWLNTTTNGLFRYSGTSWIDITSTPITVTIYQQDLLSILETETKALCGELQGWDARPWDDNQIGEVLWSTDYLASISFETAPNSPSLYDLWNDTITDKLKQWDGIDWIVVVQNFSSVAAFASGIYTFDDVNQTPETYNKWQQQNNWIANINLADTTNIQRAQRPIIEYDSRVEMNSWHKKNFVWKYRSQFNNKFELSDSRPTSIELMPIVGYIHSDYDNNNLLFLYNPNTSNIAYDNDYTDSFQAGTKFVITDNTNIKHTYTSEGAVFRYMASGDPSEVADIPMFTVVYVKEVFESPTDSTSGCIIVPLTTSLGDDWKGYHNHWLLTQLTTTTPAQPVPRNLIYVSDLSNAPVYSPIRINDSKMFPYPNDLDSSYVIGISNTTNTYQEVTTTIDGITTLMLADTLRYNTSINYFCLQGNSRVLLNGEQMYGGYQEITDSIVVPTYVGRDIHNVTMHTVVGIILDKPLPVGSIVTIVVCPDSLYDMGKQAFAVRTIEDDTQFTEQLMVGIQPEYVSLSEYIYSPQNKLTTNQYPKFNIYDVITGDIVNSDHIFGYRENSLSAIDPYIKKRIETNEGDYLFNQTLLDQSKLLAFRMTDKVETDMFWYNPNTNVVQTWYDNSWTPFVIAELLGLGKAVSTIEVTDVAPYGMYLYHFSDQELESLNCNPNILNWNGAIAHKLYYVPSTNTLYRADYDFINCGEGITILRWTPYSSVYVGADPSLQTIWRSGNNQEKAVPKWTNDKNEVVSTSLDGDWRYPDQWFYNPQHENHQVVSFKELVIHNNSIINAQSGFNVDQNNVYSLVQTFTQDMFNYGLGGTIHDYQYSFDTLISAVGCEVASIPMIIDYSNTEYKKAIHLMIELFNNNISALLYNNSDYIETLISIYENNELNAFVYGDSSSYINGTGVKNWPATAAILKMVPCVKPYLNITDTTVELVHHDGHRSNITIDPQSIVNYIDPSNNMTIKWVSQISQSQLQLKLAQLLLEIENRLYDVIDKNSDIKYKLIIDENDSTELQYYNKYKLERYSQFIKKYDIELPYVNTTFNLMDSFTWNYFHCNEYDSSPSTNEITPAACWQQLYTNTYGTPYPHLEPWVLQGYTSKPDWWDVEYLNEGSGRKWKYNHNDMTGMWSNILSGIVPVGYTLPNGEISDGYQTYLPTYSYVSVNIGDVDVDGYKPDQLLPPYYSSSEPFIRSIYNNYSYVINKPISSDYIFGDGNINQWLWETSIDYRYDQLHLQFLMQPMLFVHYNFASKFVEVNNLPIDINLHKVYSHQDTMFHGDILDDSKYTAEGLNQWYVNYNRTNGYDTSVQMREQWVNWTPKLTYQTAGIVDPDSMDITHPVYDFAEKDTQLLLVNNGVVKDIWIDGFNVTIVSIPPSSLVDDVQSKWRFELNTLSPTPHDINYYGVLSFPCGVDYVDNILTAYQYTIVEASPDNHVFYISGDQTAMFLVDLQFEVTGSINNNTFTIAASSYELATDRTKIMVSNPNDIVSDETSGVITLLGYQLPWQTGDMVVITTDNKMPIPLHKNTPYYVHRIGTSNSFKLSMTARDATAGVCIDINNSNEQTLLVSQVLSSFVVYQGRQEVQTMWYHYAIDRSRVLKISPPSNIRGMQSLFNIIDGYYAYQQDQGVLFDAIGQSTYDEVTGRNVTWQTEIERFIDWAYGIKAIMMTVNDRYELTVDVDKNMFYYKNANPLWTDGTQVSIVSRVGSIPAPLLADIGYYVQNIPTAGKMVLSLSQSVDDNTSTGLSNDTTLYTVTINCNNYTYANINIVGSLIQTYGQLVQELNDRLYLEDAVCSIQDGVFVITSTINEQKSIITISDDLLFSKLDGYVATESFYGDINGFRLSVTKQTDNPANIVKLSNQGSGAIYVTAYASTNKYPSFEINPSRDNIWISTPQGVLADVVSGPYKDYKIQQTIFDQYGRPLTADKLTVYRQDLRSHIQIRPQIKNDVNSGYDDQYNYIHIGSGHLFIEAYEHFLLFNDYTTDGGLIYDPFLGLRAPTLHLDYFESSNYTLRPNMGGYYLINGTFQRNIEGSIEDMQNIYATHSYPEVIEFTDRGRAITGYQRGAYPFLDLIDVPKKSQFDFYRGMIKHKGSSESLVAYSNNNKIVDLSVDEYWAWKVAEYGESRTRIYPEIKLKSTDSINDDIRLMFLTNSDDITDSMIAPAVAQGFEPISFTVNNDRWYQFPQQRDLIKTSMFLNGKISSRTTIFADTNMPIYNSTYGIQYWYDKNELLLKKWNISTSSWEQTTDFVISTDSRYVYLKHAICDGTRVIRYSADLNSSQFGAHIFEQGTGVDMYTDVNAEVTRISYDSFKDIIMIFLIEPSRETNSPAQLVDIVDNTVVKTIPLWHPAVGIHYHLAEHSINIMSDVDPAQYNSTIIQQQISEQFWNQTQVGQVWLDTSQLGYMPYYDKAIYPDCNDRLYNWGKQTDWSRTKVYQWVQSPVSPSQWDSQAAAQKNNTVIPQKNKISGTAKKSRFNRTRKSYLAQLSGSPLTSITITNAPTKLSIGDLVMFTTSGTLPPLVALNVQYSISNLVNDGENTTIEVIDITSGNIIEFSGGTGDLYVVPSFDLYQWVKQPSMFEKHIIAIDYPGLQGVVEPVITLSGGLWNDGDYVQLYVNGTAQSLDSYMVTFNGSDYILDLTGTNISFNEKDIVVINRSEQPLSESQQTFDPSVVEDSSIMIQWTEDYEFSTVTNYQGVDNSQIPVTTFYFWVENNITNESSVAGTLTPVEIAATFKDIPIPYFIVQDPQNDPYYRDIYGYGMGQYGAVWSVVDLNDPQYIIPIVYRQSILRKLSDIVRDDNRYIIRFVSNFAKRDSSTNNKDFHEDWMLIRREQNDRIDYRLWTALTEAVVGYKNNSQIPVPSFETIQYDAINNTDTQYGLAENQAFVNKAYALDTIKHYITKEIDPNKNSIDVSSFVTRYPLDSPANIKAAMDEIYSTFPARDINNIWFNTLLDALSTKSKYTGIMKTSWISIKGTQPFRNNN